MTSLRWMGMICASLLATACGGDGVNVSTSAAASRSDLPTVFEFERMIGVPRPYTGAANAIRGVPGGGLPWVVGEAEAKLSVVSETATSLQGILKVEVKGLVFDPNDAVVQERGIGGTNTVASFRAAVSCRTVNADGTAGIANVFLANPMPAGLGPASQGGGDAETEQPITLPKPCIAPIVFVTNPGGAWFAASGF